MKDVLYEFLDKLCTEKNRNNQVYDDFKHDAFVTLSIRTWNTIAPTTLTIWLACFLSQPIADPYRRQPADLYRDLSL